MNKIWLLLLGFMTIAPSALAQTRNDFPNRPIKMIVPFSPGGTSDLATRFFGGQLAALLGQPVVVENRPGGNGAIAVAAIKNAPADGYTILLGSNSLMSVNPIMVKDLSYDPIKDLRPLCGLIRGMIVLVVPSNSKLKTFGDFVSAAKKAPKLLSVGTVAPGYVLTTAWLGSLAGFEFMNIPYKGGGPMFTDLMGGNLDSASADMTGAAPLLKAGKLHALAVSGEKRHVDFPDVPTVAESGYPNYSSYLWVAFFVHSETQDDVTAKLADSMQKILSTDSARAFAKTTGGELMPLGPAAMREFQINEINRFRDIAKVAGITAQ